MDGGTPPPRMATLRGVPLRCPCDGAPLIDGRAQLHCLRCYAAFPVIGGMPVLINDATSAFAIADYLGGDSYEGASYGRQADRTVGLRRRYRRLARRLADSPSSLRSPDAQAAVADVRTRVPAASVLVIGGTGGLEIAPPVLHIDLSIAQGVDGIADPHDLPFPDCSFDLVIATSILDHMADPQRCVAEMWRVLAPEGRIYATTPFLQPVHMGPHDFTRFTPMGQRRLFRHFDELGSGVALGSSSVAAWTLEGLLNAVSPAPWWRRCARLAMLLATPALRRLDGLLPHTAKACGGSWFYGQRRNGPPISDRQLVTQYHFGASRDGRLEHPNTEPGSRC